MSINNALLPVEEGRSDSSRSSTACCQSLRERNLTIATANGRSFFGGPIPRLMTYNPRKVPYLEFTLPGTHSGWQTDPWLWTQSLASCAVALAIGFLTPNEAKTALDEQLATIEGIGTAIETLVAFLVGGFVIQVVGAWNERRTNYAGLVGSMRSLLLGISSCVSMTPGSAARARTADAAAAEALVRASRKTMGRYVLLACELAVLKPRGHMDTDRGRAHLERLQLLEAGEWEAMVAGDRHTSVLCWVQAICVELARRSVIDGTELKIVSESVGAARSQANDLMGSTCRDLPMPYTNMVAWLVRLAVLLQTIVHGLQVRGYDDPSCIVYSAVGLFLYAFFFLSFVGMHRVLYNPFLERLIDVGHEPIVNEGLARLAEGLMRGVAFLPPAFPTAPSRAPAEEQDRSSAG